jgi:DNA helicase-4
LQADFVILIGLHTRNNAFPSEIADDPLLQMVMPEPEVYPHAEERRLFYVALTRAKHRVYLLGGKYTPSCFLSEIGIEAESSPELRINEAGKSELYVDATERCPECDVGYLRKRKGKHGPFFGCSDYPSCRYTRKC